MAGSEEPRVVVTAGEGFRTQARLTGAHWWPMSLSAWEARR